MLSYVTMTPRAANTSSTSRKPRVRPDGTGDDGSRETEALQARLSNVADHKRLLWLQPARVNKMTKLPQAVKNHTLLKEKPVVSVVDRHG